MRPTRAQLQAELDAAKARIAELETQLTTSRQYVRELMMLAESVNKADDNLIGNLSSQVEKLQDEILDSRRDLQAAADEIDRQDLQVLRLQHALLRHVSTVPQ